MVELKKDSKYLIKRKYIDSTPINEITLLFISENAYKIKYHRSDGTIYVEWKLKKDFHNYYNIIEELPTEYVPLEINSVNTIIHDNTLTLNTKICPVCGGEGEIQDNDTTTGVRTCPNCHGTGWIIS